MPVKVSREFDAEGRVVLEIYTELPRPRRKLFRYRVQLARQAKSKGHAAESRKAAARRRKAAVDALRKLLANGKGQR